MKYLWMAVLFCLLPSHAHASADDVRRQAELSMMVTGSVDIEEDGSVSGYRLDKPDALPPLVVKLVEKTVPAWEFEPTRVDGKLAKVRSPMAMRVVASGVHDENSQIRVSIAGASFEGAGTKDEFVSARRALQPPEYPSSAVIAGVGGVVYVVMEVGREGKPLRMSIERVNLSTYDTERNMGKWRQLLGNATLQTARRWRFQPPTVGAETAKDAWTIRVPVEYARPDAKPRGYGQWETYIPGPYQATPWVLDARTDKADALVAGSLYPVDRGPRLLTPLGGS